MILILLLILIVIIIYLYIHKSGSKQNKAIPILNINLELKKDLYVEITSPKKCKFEGLIAEHTIIKQTDKYIKYCIKQKEINTYNMRYPYINQNYLSSDSVAILLRPDFPFYIRFKCNRNLYISGVGQCSQKTIVPYKKFLVVIADEIFTAKNKIILAYPPNTHFQIPKEKIIKYINKIYNVYSKYFGRFKINNNFLVNYTCLSTEGKMGSLASHTYRGINIMVEGDISNKQIKRSIRHEFMHEYINQMKFREYGIKLWFVEGFNEFFAHYLYCKKDEFKEIMEKHAEKYKKYYNPEIDYNNLTIEIYEKKENVGINYYLYAKGFFIALNYLKVLGAQEFIARMRKLILSKGIIKINDIFIENIFGPIVISDL